MSLVEKAMRKVQAAAADARPPAEELAILEPADLAQAAFVDRRNAPSRAVCTGVAISLDRVALLAEGLTPPQQEERQIAEQFRQIKRPLVTRALTPPDKAGAVSSPRVIAVTSALPGEGKTFTSLNLALSLAMERDLNVLLVDGDVAKAHLSRLAGLAGEPGLLDAIQLPGIDIESLVHATDTPHLAVLGAGQRSDRSTEMLASRRMSELLAMLVANDPTRVVVMDCPPLLLTNESRVVMGLAGQVLVVVKSGKTAQRDVVEALTHVPPGRAIGLVLNQSLSKNSAGYYGYHLNDRAS
jgi:exopolysaccharide/PEP-CTERM locus tyrosine autokinase